MPKNTITEMDLRDKRVLVRVDFNVPIDQGVERLPAYDHRLRATLPTIYYLMGSGAKIILCSHLGRPKGKPDESLRLGPVAQRLEALLLRPVAYVDDCLGPKVEEAVKNMQPQDVLLLENLRFHPGEEANDPAFAKALASLADVFVMDAFGVAHREHASVVGVTKYLPSGAGFLLQREIELLGRALNSPAKPFGAIFGGAKVSDKILVMEKLLEKLDAIFIGGGLVATFLHSLGYPTGASRVEIDRAPVAARMLKLAKEREIKVFLPVDVVVAESFKPDARHSINVHIEDIPPGWVIMDIGRRTLDLYKLELSKCKMVVWNGPMGVFEFPSFAQGTSKIAQTLANLNAITIVGGGSTAEAVEQLGLVYRMTHVSTGGGASMEFLEGRELPGIRALPDKDR